MTRKIMTKNMREQMKVAAKAPRLIIKSGDAVEALRNAAKNKLIENLDDKIKEDKTFKLQGRISFRGLDIAVENRKGSVRRGVDDDGEEWKTKMFYPYGYIRRTEGVDGDAVDCFVGHNKESDKVFIIHQRDPETSEYDEDKVMLGFDEWNNARDAFLAHYNDQEFLGKHTEMNFETFKEKVFKTKKKPGMIKSLVINIGRRVPSLNLRKIFKSQMDLFGAGNEKKDVIEGETRIKDGKTYIVQRSKKNPNVRRVFRAEKPKPKPKEGQINLEFDKPKKKEISKVEKPTSGKPLDEMSKRELNKHIEKKAEGKSGMERINIKADIYKQIRDAKKRKEPEITQDSNVDKKPKVTFGGKDISFGKKKDEAKKQNRPDNIYTQNYDALKEILPNLDEMNVEFYEKLKSKSYMDLSIDGLYQMIDGRLVFAIEHNYTQNGDLMSDPRMDIAVDQKNGTIEALFFEQHGGVPVSKEVYTYDDKGKPEKVDLKEKKGQNKFLKQWLKNLKDQGFKFTAPTSDTSPASRDIQTKENNEVRKDNDPKDKSGLVDNFGVSHLDKQVRKQRIELNKKVKDLLNSKSDKEMTDEDIKLLAQYSGRGGTDEVSLNEYYTPEYVAKFQWDMLNRLGFKGGSVLEPSCGTGVFLHTAPGTALMTGVEFDETSSRIAGILFPEQEVLNMSFEEFNTSKFDKSFDAAIGNVPFGPRGALVIHDKEKMKYNNHEQYFMDRIIDDLEEGGIASIIVPTGIMDNQISDYRIELNKKAEFLGAVRMPTGVFEKANAQVTTDIVFFKKRPEEVIDRFQKLERTELSDLYDSQILDAEFVNGNFFEKNKEFVLGEETIGNFGRKIWKGDITPEDLYKVGELLKMPNEQTDYSELDDINIKLNEKEELHVGDTIVRNGRTYRLNENHRWERVDNEETNSEAVSQEIQDKLGIKTMGELDDLHNDPAKVMNLSREQIAVLDEEVFSELEYYTSSNTQKNEMLKKAVMIGLVVKKFQRKMQVGGDVSASEAQREAQQLAMLLEDFMDEYGHPISDLKLVGQLGKSPENPLLYLCSSFDAPGNLSKLFTDPKSFYNVYHPKHGLEITDINPDNLNEVIEYIKYNGRASDYETIKSIYSRGSEFNDIEFKKHLLENEDIFIDEKGEYDFITNVCMGEVYDKLDYWDQRIKENKENLSKGNITDEERQYLISENRKLETQQLELRRRAGIRNLEDLPVNMSDAVKYFDIKYLNHYLRHKLDSRFKGEIVFDEARNLFTFADRELNEAYKLYISRGTLDKEEKQQLKELLKYRFDKDNSPDQMVILNYLNSLTLGNVTARKKELVKLLDNDFIKYLAEEAPDREEIENKYNRSYNNFIQKEYDASPIDGINVLAYDRVISKDKKGNDLTVRDAIKSHQWQAVRRFHEQKKGLIAHGVGLGKTLEAILLGGLAKSTGDAKKPTYVVPKSVLGNWLSEIERWTEGAKVLIVGSHLKVDGKGNPILDEEGHKQYVEDSKDEKKLKLSQLVNEEHDFVLMTRDFYSGIKMNPQTAENMVNELVEKFYVSRGDENDKKMKQKKEAMAAKLSMEFIGSVKKDKFGNYEQTDEIYFDNLGIDMVIANEGHSNKNLIESVLYSDIKYLNVKHSQRATDFYFKSKIIRNNNGDKGVFSLTATPISNSPMESFNMLLPIAEKEFEQMGINNVDDFIKKFAEVDSVPTMNAGAKVTYKNVFTAYKNLNLLRKMFFKHADFKTADDVGAEVHFPKENANFVHCEQSDDQKKIMKGLKLRLGLHEYKNADFDEAIKQGTITAQEVEELKAYREKHEEKRANISMLTGKPLEETKDHYFSILDDMKKATADLDWYGDAKSHWADPLPDNVDISAVPKVRKLSDSVITKHKDGAKQLIFATNTTLHYKLKDLLAGQGISPDEILIVNGKTMKTSDSRLKASRDFNNGKYKIVIGNYDTMGEGLNFNIGTTDIHHLQPAWNSLAIDQGNGRGIRQGNELDNVNTYYYLTKGTIDAFFNQKILDKRGFVNQILKGTEDRMVNDEGDISADEMQIALADDPGQARKLLEKKNEAMQGILKERSIHQNYRKLDELFSMKSRMGRMDDKKSMHYQTLQKELDTLKNELNNSENFTHKDVLNEEQRPIILPGSKAVIKMGSVVSFGAHQKAIITNYSHSTGKVTLKEFSPYSTKERVIKMENFAPQVNKTINVENINANDYFNKLVNEDKTSNIDVIEALPKEILSNNKMQLLANLQRSGYENSVIARKPDGSIVGADTAYALKNDYTIIFPQEREDFFNYIDKALKTSDNEYDKTKFGRWETKSNDHAIAAAERIYGEKYGNRIKYLIKKAKGEASSESDDLEFEETGVGG